MSGIIISSLSFSYPQQSLPLFSSVSLSIGNGWTGFAGSNGCGKTTLALLIAGKLCPDSGSIKVNGRISYCPQIPEEICVDDYQYLYDYSADSMALKRVLRLSDEMYERTETLSGGEKKRLQLFLALSSHTDILILDEPTNHLDERNKEILLDALRSFRGTGILISHDRSFMDRLTERTVIFIDDGHGDGIRLISYPLSVSAAFAQKTSDERTLLNTRKQLENSISGLKRLRQDIDEDIQGSGNRLSKKNISPKDHDAQGRIDAARLSGKDRRAGDKRKVVSGKISGLEDKLSKLGDVHLRKEGLSTRSFSSLYSTLSIPAGTIQAGSYRLDYPALGFPPGSRTAICGDNGTGKSLLVSFIAESAIGKWGNDKVAFLRQEYTDGDREEIIRRYMDFDDDGRGRINSDLYRLGADISSMLESEEGLSPGEMRKLDFILSVSSHPGIVIMDEPTNHLDITSVMAMEEMLGSGNVTLILVTHDIVLRDKLCTSSITIERNGCTGKAIPDY